MIYTNAPTIPEITAAQSRTLVGLPPQTDPLYGDMIEVMRLRLEIARLTAELSILKNGHHDLP